MWNDLRSPSSSPAGFPDRISREISEGEFQEFQELIYREAGIWLSPAKATLLAGRLSKRMRPLGVRSFHEYYCTVSQSTEECMQMLDAISTNETRFFREPTHFQVLKEVVFPEWIRAAAGGQRARTIRILCAGCSTGQEPYSLAMTLLDHFPAGTGWDIEIIGADLSTRALNVAKSGIWPADAASEIPRRYLEEFMLKGFGDQAGKIKAGLPIRSLIQFVRLNLNQTPYPLTGKFDLIFCRNVLIYFDTDSRKQAVRRLATFLPPDGYFFVGHAESLYQMGDLFRSCAPAVYRLARGTDPPNCRKR